MNLEKITKIMLVGQDKDNVDGWHEIFEITSPIYTNGQETLIVHIRREDVKNNDNK